MKTEVSLSRMEPGENFCARRLEKQVALRLDPAATPQSGGDQRASSIALTRSVNVDTRKGFSRNARPDSDRNFAVS